jgi:uncharacterized DUF497 family protein
MARMVFEWDDADDEGGNVLHLARHGITPAEAERVVRDPRNPSERSRSSTYPITFGRTKGGKFIALVWSAIGTNPVRVRVITGYQVDRGERKP